MNTQTIYVAEDGSRWDTEAEAKDREALCLAVADVMAPLGPRHDAPGCDYQNGAGYVQHTPEAVAEAKRGLIRLTRRFLSKWMSEQETIHGMDLMTVHASYFGRVLDGCANSRPVEDAWRRMWCIDVQNREWGQPYYTIHLESAQQFEIKR